MPECCDALDREKIQCCLREASGRPVGSGAGPLCGDRSLNPGMERSSRLIPAAVLILLVEHESSFNVLLTRRTDHLDDHAGEISFPGGRLESRDAGAEAAALRETAEETGLDPAQVEILGRLSDYETRTGYRVTPVVGLTRAPMNLSPDPHEVAEIFEVPLSFLVNPANHRKVTRPGGGVPRYFYRIAYDGRDIWGATAGMIVNLSRALEC